ncbi:MAG: phage virion morphogenesis protein [Verrucomicrobia bacterium]|nr:phage virion morphogenesis protein [Verrucomicrobiota bacterium]
MQARFTVMRDLLTPRLRAMARKISDKRPLLEAMGLALVSVTQRAFNDESLRPSAWAPKKSEDGRPLLKRSGLLWRSARIVALDGHAVTVGTDRPYAAAHQFGTGPYTIRPRGKRALYWPGAGHPVGIVHHPGLPPRPFFPFDASGRMTPAGQQRIRSAAMAKIAALLKPNS